LNILSPEHSGDFFKYTVIDYWPLKKLTHQNQSEYVVENLRKGLSNLNPLIYFYELMHSVREDESLHRGSQGLRRKGRCRESRTFGTEAGIKKF